MSTKKTHRTGLAGLPEVIVAQLGYRPNGSVVVVALRTGGRVAFISRWDAAPSPEARGAAVQVVQAMKHSATETAVVLAWEDREHHNPGAQVIEGVAEQIEDAGFSVAAILEVSADLITGRQRDETNAWVPLRVERPRQSVAGTLPPCSSREHFAQVVAYDSSSIDLPTEQPTAAAVLDLWEAIVVTGEIDPVIASPAQVGGLAVGLSHKPTRDAVCAPFIAAHEPEGNPELVKRITSWGTPDAEAVTERLRTLCRRVPDEHAADLLAVLAIAALKAGEPGGLAIAATERALRACPDHQLARLVATCQRMGVQL